MLGNEGEDRPLPSWAEKKMDTPPLTKAEIKKAFHLLNHCAKLAGAKYALIGGALLRMMDLLPVGFDTRDIDVASDKVLDGHGIWPNKKAIKKGSCRLAGHYLVDDICVDWMTKGRDGSVELYKAAVESAYLKDDIWLANLEFSMAIKLYAGRPQDIALFRELVDNGVINGELVKDIIRQYCPRKEIEGWLDKI